MDAQRSHKRLRSAIVGLGQVGLLFDEEPERKNSGEIWTHFSAYQTLKSLYDLVAVVDPDESKLERASKRDPNLACFLSIEKMLSNTQVDVVSICTPDSIHLSCLHALLGAVRGIFLEKPICEASKFYETSRIEEKIKNSGTSVRVNYYKTREHLFEKMMSYLDRREIRYLSAKYSGPFEAVGSHALNLMVSLTPSLSLIKAFRFPREEGDGFSALFQFNDTGLSELIYCGLRRKLIFELDILGKDRRMVLERNFSILRHGAYQRSLRYRGYEELEMIKEDVGSTEHDRFIPFLREIYTEISEDRRDYKNFDDAMKTQEMMYRISRRGDG
jgi:predicted dehydrogenase